MSLLSAVAQACNEMGITAPAALVGSTDPQAQQLLALATREALDFFRLEGPWMARPRIRKEYTFNLVPVGPFTGTVTGGSTTISSLSSVAGLVVGYGISGNNIAASATIVSIGANSVVMSIAASGTATTAGVSINFGQIAYDLPSDYDFMISQTNWDRNFRWQMLGPMSPQEWQTIISGISPVGPRIRFRLMGGKFYIQPLPGAGQTDQIVFEYASNAWCTDSTGVTYRSAWAADTDLYLFNEDTLACGVKWRFRAAKGLEYSQEFQNWQTNTSRDIAREGGSRSLPLNASNNILRLLNSQNVPDTGFGT